MCSTAESCPFCLFTVNTVQLIDRLGKKQLSVVLCCAHFLKKTLNTLMAFALFSQLGECLQLTVNLVKQKAMCSEGEIMNQSGDIFYL